MSTLFVRAWIVCAALLLAGCGRIDLYTNLSEQQANEVAAVLLAAEIDADKQLSETKAWAVRIQKSDLPRAMDVLDVSGYPKLSTPSMADIFKKDGFISSPLEERARFISATQLELQQTISRMNGVLDARVHLAMPERDPLTDQVIPPSASVSIRYAQNVKFAESGGVADVKALVRDAVEGLAVDRITVLATPTVGPWRYTLRPSGNQLAGYAYQKPWVPLEGWIVIGIVAAAGLGWGAWRTRHRWMVWARVARKSGLGGKAMGV
jgi:type III secretion protein J